MRFEELPDFPKIWIDFLNSELPFLPAAHEILKQPARLEAFRKQTARNDNLLGILTDPGTKEPARALENLQKLRQPESVAVIANYYLGLLGGPAFQIFKCLAAIKVSEELKKHGLAAVPVCWINPAPPIGFSRWSTQLLDSESELHCLRLQGEETRKYSPEDPLPWNEFSALLSLIEELGREAFDNDTIGILRAAFAPEATFSSSVVHLITELMGEWGMVVVDANTPAFKPVLAETLGPILNRAGSLESLIQKQAAKLANAGYVGEFSGNAAAFFVQALALPVAACVLDPQEVYSYAATLAVLDDIGLLRPMAWPQPSATIVDARSRRILDRYDLSIPQLYAGEESIQSKIIDAMPHSIPDKLDSLVWDVETRIAQLKALCPTGDRFAKRTDLSKQKIIYQLKKLRKQCIAARARREQAVNRQIHKVCNSLAPNRRIQERELAAIQIPLRYSRAGLRSLYEKLDIMKFEHQLIAMD